MLEIQFQKLITKILEVETGHQKRSDDGSMLNLEWQFVFNDFSGWTVLSARTEQRGGYWIHPVLFPESNVAALVDSLPHFNVNPSPGAYSQVSSGRNEHWIEPYWDESKPFEQSEIQLYFRRRYDGHPRGEENYIELNQLVTHTLGLDWSPRKGAFCFVDDLGEEVEKIKLIEHRGVELILIRRRLLDKLLYLGKWVLVQYTSFQRWRTQLPAFQSSKYEEHEFDRWEGKFEIRKCGSPLEFTEFRGAVIKRPIASADQLLCWSSTETDEGDQKQYGKFIVQDWKNEKILRDYSIEPSNFANYFTESNLPFETSPIFFKAEVLDRYKNNPDRYDLNLRTISCRGGWYLQSYDINEYNQVHTYAVYLARLPYKEQLYWLAFNEEPKGPISKQSYQTDFLAKWPDEFPIVDQLKRALEELECLTFDGRHLWSPKGGSWENASKGLHLVNTENANQWHDFIISLANATNEGFDRKALTKLASKFGSPDEKLGPLGLLKFILKTSGHAADIPATQGILEDLQVQRGKGKAHGAWQTPSGSLIEDSKLRTNKVIDAIKKLTAILSSLVQ